MSSSVRVYYEADSDRARLHDRVFAIIGYGSQGSAHAQNLRDSGARVIVGLRPGGASWQKATADGLEVRPVADAARAGDVIMMLVPDQEQRAVYESAVAPALERKTLMFAHGFNIHFGEIKPPAGVDVSMIAPKSPGGLVRSEYQAGRGVPGLVAIHQDASGSALPNALAYATGIGCSRAGVIATTFAEETETDLFGEQAVLCGGVTALVQAGFETLTEAGYAPEMAYFECLHELKLIVDLIYRGGLGFMRHSISNTAEYGDLTRGARVISPAVREEMRKLLADIRNGVFAKEWIAECRAGAPRFNELRRAAQNSVMAIRLGGKGDLTDTNVLWRYSKVLPDVPCPLIYKGVLYLVRTGGIATTLNPATGEVLKQARLMGALDGYYSSPVGADGKVYMISEAGKVSVLKAGAQWEVLAVNDMEEEAYATPAIAEGKIYLRTRTTLYCFASR